MSENFKDFKYLNNHEKLYLEENLGNSCCGYNSGVIFLKGNAGDFFGYENVGCIIVEGNCGISAARDNGQLFREVLIKNGKKRISEERDALFYIKGSVKMGFGNNNSKKGICYADEIGDLSGIDNKGIIIGKKLGSDIGYRNKGVIVALESIKMLYEGANTKNIILPGDERAKIYVDKLNELLKKYGFENYCITLENLFKK